MLSNCIFCCESCENKLTFKDSENINLLGRFFKFLERYLKEQNDKSNCFSTKQLFACESCLKSVKSFCDLYHDFKTIQLLLNWQLWTINNILKSNEFCISKTTDNRSDRESSEDVFRFREQLIQKLTLNLSNSFPKIILHKSDSKFPISHNANLQGLSAPVSLTSLDSSVKTSEKPSSSSFVKKAVAMRKHLKSHSDLKRNTKHQRINYSKRLLNWKSYQTKTRSYRRMVEKAKKFMLSLRIKKRFQEPQNREINYAKLTMVNTSSVKTEVWAHEKVEEMKFSEFHAIKTESQNTSEYGEGMYVKSENLTSESARDRNTERRLREVHKCSSCRKTFATLDRLSEHKRTECDNLEDEEVFSNELNFEEAQPSSEEVIESDSFSEERKPQKYKNFKRKYLNLLKRRQTTGTMDKCPLCGKVLKRESIRNHILARHPQKWESDLINQKLCKRLTHHRFKCPGANCSALFRRPVEFLLHWRDFHHNLNQENKNKLTVDILSFVVKPESKLFKTLKPNLQLPTKYARIELTPFENDKQVHYCKVESCKLPINSKEELKCHEELHGSFPCSNCSLIEDFFPNLALHELRAHHGIKSNSFFSMKCSRCDKTFKNVQNYIQHAAHAHFSLKYVGESCPICKVYLKRLQPRNQVPHLFPHLKKCHNLDSESSKKRLFRCKEDGCPAYFFTLCRLTNHMKMKHGKVKPIKTKIKKEKGSVECIHCGVSFKHQLSFQKHVRTKHPKQFNPSLFKYKRGPVCSYRFKCPHCEKIFTQVHSLLLHFNEAHQENRGDACMDIPNSKLFVDILAYSVNPDSTLFKSLDTNQIKPMHFAKIELSLPKTEQIQICEVESCRRPFYSKKDFEDHQKLHGKFTCVKCPVTKSFLPELSTHEVNAHAQSGKKHRLQCLRCPLDFSETHNYIRHHVTAHFSLNFSEQSCPICRTYLKRYEKCKDGMAELFQHLKQSHNLDNALEKIYICDETDCSAYFRTMHGLSYHRRLDHGMDQTELKLLKNRVCDECGKLFKSKLAFQTHLLSHSGPTSWEFCCEICSKKCLSKQKLDEHMRVHTKDKPFICQVCGVKYSHRHNLRIHVNNKHGDVVQDVAKKVSKPNLTSRKGIKRNQLESKNGECRRKNKRRRRKKTQKENPEPSKSDSE